MTPTAPPPEAPEPPPPAAPEEAPVEQLAPPPPPPPPRWREALDFLDHGWPELLLALGILLAPGAFVGSLLAPGGLAFVLDNKLPPGGRLWILIGMGISLLFGGGALVLWLRAKLTAGEALQEALRRANRRTLGALALAPLLPLLHGGIETQKPALTLFFAFATGLLVALWIAALPTRRLPGAAVLLGAIVAAGGAWLAHLAVQRHHALLTKIFDLGIYDSIFFHNTRGEFLAANFIRGGTHVSAHVDPILILLSPLYLLYPRAESILVLQALWLAAGAIPVFLLARDRLGQPGVGVLLAVAWLAQPALHGAAMYDFHSLALVTPLLPLAVWALDGRRWVVYGVTIGALLLCREDVSLLCSTIALWAAVTGRSKRAAAITLGASVLYLAFVKLVIMPDASLLMPDSKESYGYAYYYEALIPNPKEGVRGLVLSLVANPTFTLAHVFTEEKLLFFGKLFVPLLFLPLLLARRAWLLLAYGLAFLFLASKGAVFSLHYQYPVVLFPLAFAATVLALAEPTFEQLCASRGLELGRARTGLAAGMAVASLLVGLRFGAVAPNAAFKPGGQPFVWRLDQEQQERWDYVDSLLAKIPADKSVAATDHLGPHISNRDQASGFPSGRGTELLLVDTANMEPKARRVLEQLESSGAYRKLEARKTISLWERDPSRPIPPRPP